MIKDLLSKLMFYVSVPKCIFCGKKLDITDKALCKECLIHYENHKQMNCPQCARPYNKCSCPNLYLLSHGVKRLFKVFKYKAREISPQNSLIYSLKKDNRRDVFSFCSYELTDAILSSLDKLENTVITNIPRRKSAINKYGYDHARILAKYISRRLNIKYESLLSSKSKESQKEMKSSERIKNVNFKLKRKSKYLKGKTVIIVDDVVTTGSSMGVASMLLRSLGAKHILGATVSIAYRDDKTLFNTGDRFFRNYK
jgi:competence protein ComFC